MFATRPMQQDPFFAYNSPMSTPISMPPRPHLRPRSIFTQQQQHPLQDHIQGGQSWKQQQHQPHPFDQDMGQLQQQPQQQPQQQARGNDTGRRKRSFHFEPEFVAALDASLHEQPSPPPVKKLRKRLREPTTSSSQSRLPSEEPELQQSKESSVSPPLSPQPCRPSHGVSIIDLASGEELTSLHLGENEHKRPRESENYSTSDSAKSSTESLREVFDVLEDGTLRPVLDHVPSVPSPVKRMRIHRSPADKKNAAIKILEEQEQQKINTRQRKQDTAAGRHTHKNHMGNSHPQHHRNETMSGHRDVSFMSMDDTPMTSTTTTKAPASELGALIRYEGPKTNVSLADGVDTLIRKRWTSELPDLSSFAQGNELILYRPPPPSFLTSFDNDDDDDDDEDSQESFARIEELHDDEDDGYATADYRMDELEEKIMDMDLD